MNTRTDSANINETLSFRVGAALRDNTVTAFVRGLYLPELTELTTLAPVLAGSMVGEQSTYTLTAALYARTEQLDAAASRVTGRGAAKFRAMADAAQAAQVAWTLALQASQRARRAA